MTAVVKKISDLIRNHWGFILYCAFGIFTTIVNYAVYYPMVWWTPIPAAVVNLIAWIISVVFSFLTNKPFVFKSHDWSASVVWPEAYRFVACRIGSAIVETVFLLVTDDLLQWDENWMKIIAGILVIIINYIGTKSLFNKIKK